MAFVKTRGEFFLHPDGKFTAKVKAAEDTVGQYGPQIKVVFTTGERKDDGELAELAYWVNNCYTENSKLRALWIALGLEEPEFDESADEFELDEQEMVGCRCELLIGHGKDKQGRDRANILMVYPHKKKQEAGGNGGSRRSRNEEPQQEERPRAEASSGSSRRSAFKSDEED